MRLIATCKLGLESTVAFQLRRMGVEVERTEDARVCFQGDFSTMARALLWLRTAERLLLEVGSFRASTFTELFDGVKALNWKPFLARDAVIHVNGKSAKSSLFSVSDCQSIVKKAIVENLKAAYHTAVIPETGAEVIVEVGMLRDVATLALDCCGAGLLRSFAAERWPFVPKQVWVQAREEAHDSIRPVKLQICGSDMDPHCIDLCKKHAKKAGVMVDWAVRPVEELVDARTGGVIVCNPPYGERLMDKRDAERLYRRMRERFDLLDGWSINIISGFREFERSYGRTADKRRKLSNGGMQCCLYQYFRGGQR